MTKQIGSTINVITMYDQCLLRANLKEVRVIRRLAKGSVFPGHQWPVGGTPTVLSPGRTPASGSREETLSRSMYDQCLHDANPQVKEGWSYTLAKGTTPVVPDKIPPPNPSINVLRKRWKKQCQFIQDGSVPRLVHDKILWWIAKMPSRI